MLKLVSARGVPAELQMLSRASRSPDNLSGQELAAGDDSTLEAAEFKRTGWRVRLSPPLPQLHGLRGSVRGLNWLARSHDARWRVSDTADGMVARASGHRIVSRRHVAGRVRHIRLVFHPDESAAPASEKHAGWTNRRQQSARSGRTRGNVRLSRRQAGGDSVRWGMASAISAATSTCTDSDRIDTPTLRASRQGRPGRSRHMTGSASVTGRARAGHFAYGRAGPDLPGAQS